MFIQEAERQINRPTDRAPIFGFTSQMPKMAGAGPESRLRNTKLASHGGSKGPNSSSQHLLCPRVHTGRKLELGARNETQTLQGGTWVCQLAA